MDEHVQKTSLTLDVFFPRIPTVSSELAYATTPHRESKPYEGLKPTTPVYAAGSLTEPPVSVPRALHSNDSAVSINSLPKIYLQYSRIALISSDGHRTPSRTPASGKIPTIPIPTQVLYSAKSRMHRMRSHAKLIKICLASDHGPGGL
ncbi:hypothetical protein F1880_009732 [Penicillium rolfsii]|nr:hypothetical protein F1880_009732 [Penicillium rolfsii]